MRKDNTLDNREIATGAAAVLVLIIVTRYLYASSSIYYIIPAALLVFALGYFLYDVNKRLR